LKEFLIVKTIRKYYLESSDFNGYPVYRLKKEFGLANDQAKHIIRELIKLKKIDCVFGNIHQNPYIKPFSDLPVEDQLKLLEELEFADSFCLYPSKEILATLTEKQRAKYPPYKLELALGAGQLDFRVFDLSILEYYRNDPRYYYKTDFINGIILIHDDFFKSSSMPDHNQVFLQSFGFAYDENLNRAVAVFLCYLSRLSAEHQIIWSTKALKGDYRLHPDYYRNSILGEWGTRISIFEAFVQELSIINRMSEIMGKVPLFKESFENDRPKEFGFLLRPTLSELSSFISLLDKMMSDNINKDFFKNDLTLEQETVRADGKVIVTLKGTINLLDEWIHKYFHTDDLRLVDEKFSAFRKVRQLR